MALVVQPYTAEWEPAVAAFNRRLAQGGVEFQFPERWESAWLPRQQDDLLLEEYYLATEGAEVRGGFALKHQLFQLADETVPLAFLGLPLSEGIVDPRYKQVGVTLLTGALKRQPLLFCLGMGGLGNPLPLLLRALGWTLQPVPFFFDVVHASQFLRNVAILRRRRAISVALDVAAASGLGTLALAALTSVRRRGRRSPGVAVEVVREFGSWVTDIWEAGAGQYALAAVRDVRTLRRLYPATNPKFLRLRVTRGGRDIGWAVALDARLRRHPHFGDLRLGSLVDGFAIPGGELDVTSAATTILRERGVDLIVSNQSHRLWCDAHVRCGFFSAASNFIFAASPRLAARLSPFEGRPGLLHLCRGDGEGPSGLE
jgi:hypothetical protein